MAVSTKRSSESTSWLKKNARVHERNAITVPRGPLLRALSDPRVVLDFNTGEWERCIAQARRSSLDGRLAHLVGTAGLIKELPAKVQEQLASALIGAAEHRRMLLWEVNRISQALSGIGVSFILLKGAAYAIADFPFAEGRQSSDVDIMVARDKLEEVERALLAHGWKKAKLDPYDQRYYRTWMHELPPLQHRDRGTVVDIHHTIVPLSSRLHPDPTALWRAAVDLPGGKLKIFSANDMILHTAVHLFYDGAIADGLKDLHDIDAMCRYFGPSPGFWDRLVSRALELGLQRPLFYSLRYAERLLSSPVPPPVQCEIRVGAPSPPVLALMDGLVLRALPREEAEERNLGRELATRCLYARSHWLRMAPVRLALHFGHKAMRRWAPSAR
jgi:hypothetical protein